MQTITFTCNTTRVAACAKALARSGAQSPGPLLSGEDIDEAVWAAYRLNDKTPSRKTCCFDATLLNRAAIGGLYKA